jgi:hypothetical protein
MMRALRLSALLIVPLVLAACVGSRPQNAVCPAVAPSKTPPGFDASLSS